MWFQVVLQHSFTSGIVNYGVFCWNLLPKCLSYNFPNMINFYLQGFQHKVLRLMPLTDPYVDAGSTTTHSPIHLFFNKSFIEM